MKTKAEMFAELKLLGITKQFKPYQDEQNDTILLLTSKPVIITDGSMKGCEIAIHKDCAIVWTNRKKLASKLSKLHNLKIRLLDGEAEFKVPFNLCDELIPLLGAKIKRKMSPEALVNAKSSLQKARVSIISSKNTG